MCIYVTSLVSHVAKGVAENTIPQTINSRRSFTSFGNVFALRRKGTRPILNRSMFLVGKETHTLLRYQVWETNLLLQPPAHGPQHHNTHQLKRRWASFRSIQAPKLCISKLQPTLARRLSTSLYLHPESWGKQCQVSTNLETYIHEMNISGRVVEEKRCAKMTEKQETKIRHVSLWGCPNIVVSSPRLITPTSPSSIQIPDSIQFSPATCWPGKWPTPKFKELFFSGLTFCMNIQFLSQSNKDMRIPSGMCRVW